MRILGFFFCLNVALGALSIPCGRSRCRHSLPRLHLRNSGSALPPPASPSHAGSQEGLFRFPESLLCGGTELSAHIAQTIHCALFNTPRCVPAARLVPGRAAAGTELYAGKVHDITASIQTKRNPGPNSTYTYTHIGTTHEEMKINCVSAG